MTEHSDAFLDGWVAHLKKLELSSNPYHAELQAYSHLQWDTGWTARFDACKHEGDLSLDIVVEMAL